MWSYNKLHSFRPVNLIHSSPQRLIYVCIFGAMTARLLLLILGVDVYPTPGFLENISDPLWAKSNKITSVLTL